MIPDKSKMSRPIHGETVYGVDVDGETRCRHWNSASDIIAIRFKCCGRWYSCIDCHAAETTHAATVWGRDERETKAVLCGACGDQMSISEYLACDSVCPKCSSKFNSGCSKHYHLYFE